MSSCSFIKQGISGCRDFFVSRTNYGLKNNKAKKKDWLKQ